MSSYHVTWKSSDCRIRQSNGDRRCFVIPLVFQWKLHWRQFTACLLDFRYRCSYYRVAGQYSGSKLEMYPLCCVVEFAQKEKGRGICIKISQGNGERTWRSTSLSWPIPYVFFSNALCIRNFIVNEVWGTASHWHVTFVFHLSVFTSCIYLLYCTQVCENWFCREVISEYYCHLKAAFDSTASLTVTSLTV